MRLLIYPVLCAVALLGVSCATNQSAGSAKSAPIVTPDTTLVGKVVAVNLASRYVIANFPVGRLPAPSQPLNVYRNGLKVGEVRVDTRWRRDDNVAADITVGEVQVGDEVKDR